jgi:subfamily B ATP-binding cassette protein MsbA
MKKAILYFLPYLKNYKKEIAFAIFGMAIVAATSAASANLMKPMMDEMFIKKDREMLTFIPVAIIVLFSLKGLGRFIQRYYMVYIGQDIVRIIRDKMVDHLMHQEISFLQSMRNGELISRVTSDIGRIRSLVSSTIPKMATAALTVLVLTGYVFYQNAQLAVYFFLVIPLLLFPIRLLSKKMKRYSHRSQESTADMTSRLTEIFNNMEIIKANFSQEYESARFRQESRKVFRHLMKQNKVRSLTAPITEIIGSLALALVIYLGGAEVIEGGMTVGEFFAFMAALAMLYDPIKTISNLYTNIQDAVAAFERIDRILSRKPAIPQGNRTIDRIREIEMKKVTLSYDGHPALRGIDLHAETGKVYALVGDSGAGKSSLINLLVRFYDPDSGEILVNGVPIRDYALDSLLKQIAFVTQRIFIFNDTVAQNVAYSSDYDEARVVDALQKAHAWEFVSKLPQGIHTPLDEFGTNLSGGQRQRIALARALYKRPSVLILDEATSALDNKSERAIQQALEEIRSEMITFVVAHRLTTVETADVILVFKDGRIVDRGDYRSLLEHSEEFRKLARRDG